MSKRSAKSSSYSRRFDSGFDDYMRHIRHYPVLEKEVELELARRWRDEGDEAALQRLVHCNLKLVVKISGEYRAGRHNPLDLVQEGNLGLMIAAQRFDPERGVRFASYGQWWVRAYVMRFIMTHHRVVRLGTTRAQRKLFYNLRKVQRQLRREKVEPTAEAIADRLDVKIDEVIQMQRRMDSNDLSLDVSVDGESDTTRGDMMPAQQPSVERLVIERERWSMFRERLNDFQSQLEGRDVKIWHERVIADEPLTLRELAEEFGVSRERIRQLHVRLVRKLGDFVRETPQEQQRAET